VGEDKAVDSNDFMASEGLQRRQFLKLASGLTFCFALGGAGCSREQPEAQLGARDTSGYANAWVNIAPNGEVTIVSPADEMGQGSFTALPLILAEEMDVAWDDVRIEMSPTDESVYGNPKFFNMIYTSASMTVTGYYDQLRLYGAGTRRVLLEAAAARLGVPVSELTTEPSVVVHEATGRRLSYGEVAGHTQQPGELPQVSASELKRPSQFRLIGHSVPRRDVPDKVRGTSQYALNVQLDGMVYAVAVRAPIMGAAVLTVNAEEVQRQRGVIGVYSRKNSVIVAAKTYYDALSARSKLQVDWTAVGDVNEYDSETALAEQARVAQDLDVSGFPWDSEGDITTGFSAANQQLVQGEYRSDYVYHAQIEPLNATVWAKDNGDVEAWVGTQAPGFTVKAIARTLDRDPERVTLHRCMMGGAFGRRTLSEMDWVVDAAWLSGELRAPVKVIWSREDDVASAWAKPQSAHLLRAAVDGSGTISTWHHRVAVQEPLATAEPQIYEQLGRIPLVSMMGSERPFYNFPNRLAEHIAVEPGIRTYPLLAVGTTPNQFASESFIDEIAGQLEREPLAYRRQLLSQSPRALKVLDTVAGNAQWGRKLAKGRALGITLCQYHETSLIGAVVEISFDATEHRINVHEIWTVADVGVAIQPDNIRAQIQGAVIFGLGGALTERLSYKKGRVQQSNFHDYQVPRMGDVPPIHVELLIDMASHPHAVGQIGAIVVAPAISNAFAALTGARLRHMPFTPERIEAALNA